MSNPVVVEVIRGNRIESAHRGAAAVVDETGRIVVAFGDIDRPIYPRSAVKPLQALPIIECGAAERLGLSEDEIALACASHSGADDHVTTARAMLAKAGRDESALECGAHWPLGDEAARALARSGGTPTALHNNCSGQHAGFICLACALGVDPANYVAPDHAVQREVTAALANITGASLGEEMRGVDGCMIPTYAMPLRALALGFARFANGRGLSATRRKAARRILDAIAAHPATVAGKGRFDTEIMTIVGPRLLSKGGAEGVHCAALPEAGLGLAVKADDGAGRAAQVMAASLIQRLLAMDEEAVSGLSRFVSPRLSNWSGREVGLMRPAGPLA